MQMVVARGIDRRRFIINAFGKSRPLVKETSLEDQKRNRRVEFKVLNISLEDK